MKTELVKISQVKTNKENPRIITSDKFNKLINSLLVLPKMLEIRPIVVDSSMTALGGNMRNNALKEISKMSIEGVKDRLMRQSDFLEKTTGERDILIKYWEEWIKNPQVQVINANNLSETEREQFIIKDNTSFGQWDYDMLANNWNEKKLEDWGVDVWQVNAEEFDRMINGQLEDEDSEAIESSSYNDDGNKPSINDRFIVPPFTILDTRQGYWQNRKSLWRYLLGDTSSSRADKLIKSNQMKYPKLYKEYGRVKDELKCTFQEYLDNYVAEDVLESMNNSPYSAGVSLFDPVLAECLSKWFTPYKGAKIFDCFAGDTQKGLVFGLCGYDFKGIELREEQVRENLENLKDRNVNVSYICDDGRNVDKHFDVNSQDLLFSCPPYYDLEVYSSLDNDASNQNTYEDFLAILKEAYSKAIKCLRDNRFVVIVVGDIRNKKDGGSYYDFPSDIKNIFKENGLHLYNELILVEQIGTSALRCSKSMETRKVSKTHQNILVFYKGDLSEIKNDFNPITYRKEDDILFESIAKINKEDNDASN